jgi:hypothetical protein
MMGVRNKKLRQVSTVPKMLAEAVRGHFGCMRAKYGVVTMWRDDAGLYCVSEMRLSKLATTNAMEAIAMADISLFRLDQPER